jgi:HEAT repeat protein
MPARAAAPPALAAPGPALAARPPRTLSARELLARAAAARTPDELTAVMRTTHFELLEAIARDPAALGEIERYAAAGDPRTPAMRIAAGALVGAGTPEAQAALVRLLEGRPGDAALAKLLLPSLGALAKPTPATEAAVRALTSEAVPSAIRTTAHLTLGTLAARVAAADPQRAEAIVAGYVGRLGAASTREERGRYLTVLGNAGTPGAAAAIARELGDPDAAVRGRAVQALRRIATPEAEGQLRRALADADDTVRASAAWTLAYRTPSPETMRALLDRLAAEPSEPAATALLDTLWARRRAAPDLVEAAVRGAAGRHASPAVRAHARALLDGTS